MTKENREIIREFVVQRLKSGDKSIRIDQNAMSDCGLREIEQEAVFYSALEILNEQLRNGNIFFDTRGGVRQYDYLPNVIITEQGKEAFNSDEIPVYDPDGYLTEINASIPDLDPVIYEYLKESVHSFNRDCIMSSAITLGVASEKMILLLFESLEKSLKDDTDKKMMAKAANRKIFDKHKSIETMLRAKNKILPKEIYENCDLYLSGLFHLIRLHRNEFGHPTGTQIEKSVIRVFLKCFGIYLKKLYDLKEFLDKNPLG